MKRFAIALLLLLAGTAAFALDTTKRGNRIGILRTAAHHEEQQDEAMASAIRRYLREELTRGGYDAFDAQITYDDLNRNATVNADYYIEIAASDAGAGSYGGIGVGGPNVAVDISVVVARVAAEIRLYDGRTLELVKRFELEKSKKGIAPTGVGVGGRNLIAWIAVPFVEMVQFRAAAREVAHQAAKDLTEYVRVD